MRFIEKDMLIRTPAESDEVIPAHSEVWDDGFLIRHGPMQVGSILPERIVDGRTLLEQLQQIEDRSDDGARCEGVNLVGASLPTRRSNPYDRLFGVFNYATKHRTMFSEQAIRDIAVHLDDIITRRNYYAKHLS